MHLMRICLRAIFDSATNMLASYSSACVTREHVPPSQHMHIVSDPLHGCSGTLRLSILTMLCFVTWCTIKMLSFGHQLSESP